MVYMSYPEFPDSRTTTRIVGMNKEKELVIYQAANGAIELNGDVSNETIWASQKEIAQIFNVTPQNITIHLKRLFKEGELEESATCKESLHVQTEGKRKVTRRLKTYNLDVIIAVGYRINSVLGTKFRQWATQTLKQHITKGYTINSSRIETNLNSFLYAVDEVKALAKNNQQLHTGDVLALVTAFAHTWFSLESYDEDKLPEQGINHQVIAVEADELYQAVAALKQNLQEKGQATNLFAQEKNKGSLAGILGNIYQSAFGEDVYPTLEEKAANLLYFIIKNHAFNDGNKRTAAFAFIWFLQKAGIDFKGKVTPEALTSITLLIAESDADNKSRMVGLVILLLTGKSS